MEKYVQIEMPTQTDRYHLKGISVNEFIDYMVKSKDGSEKKIKDISKDVFENHKNRKFCFEFNVDDKFDVCHYILKHESNESEDKWNKTVRPDLY